MENQLNDESAKSLVRLPLVGKTLLSNRPRFGTAADTLDTASDELTFDPDARDRFLSDPASSLGGMDGAADDDLVLFNRMGFQEASAVSCSPPAAVCVAYIAVAVVSYAAVGWWVAFGVGAFTRVGFYGSALEPGVQEVGPGYISPV
jgi:hypothetical protein